MNSAVPFWVRQDLSVPVREQCACIVLTSNALEHSLVFQPVVSVETTHDLVRVTRVNHRPYVGHRSAVFTVFDESETLRLTVSVLVIHVSRYLNRVVSREIVDEDDSEVKFSHLREGARETLSCVLLVVVTRDAEHELVTFHLSPDSKISSRSRES